MGVPLPPSKGFCLDRSGLLLVSQILAARCRHVSRSRAPGLWPAESDLRALDPLQVPHSHE